MSPLNRHAFPHYLSFLLEQDLPNAAYSETSVYCYMHAENDSTYCSGIFQSHGDGHCMSSIDKGLCVCHDIVDLQYEKAFTPISMHDHVLVCTDMHSYMPMHA